MWTTSLCSGGDRNRNSAGATAKVSPGCISGGEASSCLSSNSSARSLRYANRGRGVRVEVMEARQAKGTVGSPHLRRRGEAILKLLLSLGCSSEVKIRQMLGDSPDTSKALRMCDISFSISLSINAFFSHACDTCIVACKQHQHFC